MKLDLPQLPELKIDTDHRVPAAWDFDTSVSVVLLIPESDRKSVLKAPWGDFLALRLTDFSTATNPVLLSGPRGNRTAILQVPDTPNTFRYHTLARKTLEPLVNERASSINVVSFLGNIDRASAMAEAMVAAAIARLFRLPKISSKPDETAGLRAMNFYGEFDNADLRGIQATAEGNNLARWLTQLPGNYLTPGLYRDYAEALAQREGWQARFYDIDQLKELGAGAFLSVVQASPEPDAGILHLQYRASDTGQPPLALAGKGICFDTGGSDLKVGGHMRGMNGDMQGSAVALGTLLALTRLKFQHPVDCWLALAENHIGSRAAKSNDVVTAMNGTTIELVNTDAEGRMVLADTLALASRSQPRVIVDYATLTGSCVSALGQRIAGGFTNRRDWIEPIIQTGEQCGERVWPFPFEDDYDEDLKSDVADTLQCRVEGTGDHIYAARFLSQFVASGIDWLHIDIAPTSAHKGGLGAIPSEIQGFGVRFGVEWLKRFTES
ncbi:leucyl aminopeptidase family protein [Marinobacter salinisoli]|uniref:Leucyl aminopeptidase family protein n=1 Tax=Marinobacter salinisoli TaxID=2769486 RepID=A0ABX7MR39_9GAMM|nr:leucyl aminopeptidase family protein [Marinobacter salinisoli]QSP94768.1 leucyl aminopeptidase family protein [Marinobacter salinisoli]